MQKKLYFLDEQEKNRILYLHESRTKGQYLLTEAINRTTYINKVDGICKNKTFGSGNFTDTKVLKSAKLMIQNLPNTLGYYSNSNLETISKNIRTFGTIGNYCRIAEKYKEIGGPAQQYNKDTEPSLTSWLTRYVYDDNAWILYVKQPLEELIKNSETAKEKSNKTMAEWSGYPCVYSNPNAKEIPLQDGTVSYQLIGFYFYNNGRKMDEKTRQMSSYHCTSENTIGEGPKPAGGQTQQPATNYQQVAGGYILSPFTTNVVDQIRTSIGITGQGGLNQTDINQLYAKIATLPNK